MITAKISDRYEKGAILHDSWGCEQTNQDFYCITSYNAQSGFAVLLPMKKKITPVENMIAKVEPAEIDWNAKPILKKIKRNLQTGEQIGFSFRPYAGGGWCSLWSGVPLTETSYA